MSIIIVYRLYMVKGYTPIIPDNNKSENVFSGKMEILLSGKNKTVSSRVEPLIHATCPLPAMSTAELITPVQACLNRLVAGDPAARADLLRLTRDRLLVMVRSILSRYPSVRRWEESDDVLQNVFFRLDRALAQVPIETTRYFLAVAAMNIRREVIDLARHYFGSQGLGANHVTPSAHAAEDIESVRACGQGRNDPAILAEWAEFHERIAGLPDEEREVLDLHWYFGLSHKEVAGNLGTSESTAKRRWASALIKLGDTFARDCRFE